MAPKSHHKFPSESTIARETENAIKLPSCQIWVQYGGRISSNTVTRIKMEFFYSPYQSREIENQITSVSKVQNSAADCCIVYIRSFTNSGHDFVYCVPELTNLPKFYGGTYGGRNYEGPVLAALVVLCGTILENVSPIDWRKLTKVHKHGGKFNEVRWRYLFATAKRAWSMMEFYEWGVPVLQSMVADAPVQRQESEPEDTSPGPISAGDYSPEVQRKAIHQNVELLKKKPDHQDRVFEYLHEELSGRCKHKGKDQLTQQQYYLLERLRDNADDFDTLYEDTEEDGAKRNSEVFIAEEAHLISQRDDLIRQIEEQLTLPMTSDDSSEDSDSPQLEQPSTPNSQQDADKASIVDDSSESMDIERPTAEQATVIQRFAEFTGAKTYQCEGYLFAANFDLELALSYFYEDRSATVSLDTNTSVSTERLDVLATVSKERLEALTTFQGLTNADSVVADSYLTRASWNVGTAVSAFFDDKEAVKCHSESTDESVNKIASEFSTRIEEKRVEDIPPIRGRSTKRLDRPVVLSAARKASIRNRIKYLEAKIDFLDNIIDKTDDGDVIMRDGTGSETDLNPDRETQAASSINPHTTDESKDVPQVANRRRSLSHAGLPLVLDEAGNVVSYSRPIGTPYQQYRAMRLRLQIQHYGHEAIPSDEDPHRGIPTRERCPAPLVQEEEAKDSDDSPVASKAADPPSWEESVHRTIQAKMKRDAELEIAHLVDILTDAEVAEAAQAEEIADAADGGIKVDNQQLSDWPKQAMQAIKLIGSSPDADGGESDEVDSVISSTDSDSAVDAVNSNKDTAKENRAPIKGLLKRPSRPSKPTMKVRFNLDDGPDLPTTWVDETIPEITTAMPKLTAHAETLTTKIRADSAEDEKDTASSHGGPASEPVYEEVKEEKETQDTRAEDEKGEADVEKKRNLFISKQEDNWDGLDSDEGELEPESESESDVDAEGEEEEVEEQQERFEEEQAKVKRPPRVDEKMED